MQPRKHLCCALVLVLGTLAFAQNVLIHDDSYLVGATQPAPAEQACLDLGLPHTTTPDFTTFDALLTGGTAWDLVIVQHVQVGGVPTTMQLDHLNAYLLGGGRLLFGSWRALGFSAHPLFASMECVPANFTPALEQLTWDAGTFVTCGIPSPQPLTDSIGFGIDTVTADAVPPGRALMGQVTPGATPLNGTVILASHGRSLYVGFMPILMDPAPLAGNAFLNNAVQELLFGPIVPEDLLPTSLTITPAPTVAPGSTFDVDVEFSSVGGGAKLVTVDLFHGVGEPVPVLPDAGDESQQVMAAPGGTTVASYPGIPAGGVARVLRLHAAVNCDLRAFECNTGNNVASDVVCVADAGCDASCGDCNLSGTLPVTILDALVGAQIAVSLVVPTPRQLCQCDVNASQTIDIIDALLMAQSAAGLPVALTCGRQPGGFAISLLPTPVVVPDPVRVGFDLCGAAVDMVVEFSLDGGATWLPAAAAVGSPLPSPAPGLAPALDFSFWWDSLADVPFTARPVTAGLRLVFTDPATGDVKQLDLSVDLAPGPPTLPYVDPGASGHMQDFSPEFDDFSIDVKLPFAFPFWNTPAATLATTTIGFGTNGALLMDGGYTPCCTQTPLWTFAGSAPTIHAHGADGFSGRMYSYADANVAVFTWLDMDYCCIGMGGWSTQVILLPSGDFQIRQVQATSDPGRTITIGYSDGLITDNSVPGATGLDWDAFPVFTPVPIGQVDFGSSEPSGMGTDVVLYFEYDPGTGYTAWRLQ